METSRDKSLVAEVEKHFKRWLTQMRTVIQETDQIKQDPPTVGPLDELEYRRTILAKFTAIVEFVETREFNNFLTVLKMTRSKLVTLWKEVDNYITCELNQARDNVRHVELLERFWDPLYRCDPPTLKNYLPSLMISIRNIYKNSEFYNNSITIVGLITKITNQLILACWQYLTERGTKPIWTQNKSRVIEKMNHCKELKEHYFTTYCTTLEQMEDDPNEEPWEGSFSYIFGKYETFLGRLEQVCIHSYYSTLDHSILNSDKSCSANTFEVFNLGSNQDFGDGSVLRTDSCSI